jgi:hypothetical protein
LGIRAIWLSVNDDPSYLMDAFPNDPNEFWDTDGDGIGDNSDTDIDGDGYTNINDKMPFDARDHLDSDNDGIGDSLIITRMEIIS